MISSAYPHSINGAVRPLEVSREIHVVNRHLYSDIILIIEVDFAKVPDCCFELVLTMSDDTFDADLQRYPRR